MKLYIKHMVSLRCKMAVKVALEELNIPYTDIELGEINLTQSITDLQILELRKRLLPSGLEVMIDKKIILIEKIKKAVLDMVHYEDEIPKTKHSVYISEKLGYDYTYLANIFSETKGITLEHYIIYHKIEKAKELLLYDELSLTEIAFKLHYSSVGHLSSQFKKTTGLTPTFFKKLKHKRRIPLEKL